MRVHKLLNGASLVSLSPHGFRFSDGTESDGQDRAFVDQFTLTKEFSVVREVGGMKLTRTKFVVCKEQKTLLAQVANEVTLVLVPFQFLQALQESLETGESFANVVAFNATKETTRSAPDQKVVDVNNWSVIS